jgi:hypothetical protein
MMKTKVAMAISLAGVLAAGTAAALVNTHVLNGGASAPLAVSAPKSQQSPPAPTVSTPAGGSTAVPAAANPPAAASPTQATYAIGDSGTVTLDTAGDVLKIVAVTPAPNWTVAQSETSDASNGEVKFQSGNTEVEFQANLLYGVVRTSVETHDLSATNNTVGASGGDDSGQGSGLQSGEDDGSGGDD